MLRSGLIVSALTLGSRIAGLLRDMVLAQVVGASTSADAFFVAFKIPNFLRRLFAEGAFSQAFVPVLSEAQTKEGMLGVSRLIDQVAGRLMLILFVVTCLGVLGAPWLAQVFAPGFASDPAKLALTGELLRWTFPYLFFVSLVAFLGGILNSIGRFAVPAATPIVLNISLIGAALALSPMLETEALGLAIGVFIAGALQLVLQVPALLHAGFLPRPSLAQDHPGVLKIMRLMLPALFGVSVSQINLLLDTVLASLLVSGSVSWLYYSDRLMELPLGVIAIAVSTVILPVLSRQFARGDGEGAQRTQSWALWVVMLLGLPSAMALGVFAELILSTLFQYGAMTVSDIEQSAGSLLAYAFGLPAFMAIKVLAPHYFSRQDTTTPVKIGLVSMGANMAFNLLLVWEFAHIGLAAATSLSAWLNASLLLIGLHRRGWYVVHELPWAHIAKLGLGLLALSLVGVWAPDAAELAHQPLLIRALWTGGLLSAAGVLYLGVLWMVGIRYTRVLVPPTS